MHFKSLKSPLRRLWKTSGGLLLTKRIPDHKSCSNQQPIKRAKLPKQLIIPLLQHIGNPAAPIVVVGDHVLKGQMIAEAQGVISAPVHASSSGTVVEINDHPVPHPSGLSAPCIIIETDGLEEWVELPKRVSDFTNLEPGEIRDRICNAGIVGLGGATFPSSVKLNPGPNNQIHTLVINGAECEPFITCDDQLMREHSERVVTGAMIICHLLRVKECLIAIEDDKPEAIASMTEEVAKGAADLAEVVTIPTRYPSGGEKQLIYLLTGKEVPSGGIPAHIGMVCHNVATAAAVADAVLKGRPLISRIVTITGDGVVQKLNMDVLIGTAIHELAKQAGGYTDNITHCILGGPMMGFTLHDDRAPIIKGTNCLLATGMFRLPAPEPARPCIRCGKCASACPMDLLPMQMYWHARAGDLKKAQDYNLFDCIQCGCCSMACPAHIPLVQYFHFSQSKIKTMDKERLKAKQAGERHEAREARLNRLEAEKQTKLRAKKEALKKKSAEKQGNDPKRAAIEAAIKRAEEKKALLKEQGIEPKNLHHLTEAQQLQKETADQRRSSATEPQDN